MVFSNFLDEGVKQHYTRSNLCNSILEALTEADKDIDDLKPQDIKSMDEFHIRGREATIELARAAGLDENMRVLDIGSGIGGPSRSIALEFGCRVTGIDLTDEYCQAATMLAELTGLSHLVGYRHANALDLPFSRDDFDVVWTQHAAMNIQDKATFYQEISRVLKPQGTLVIHDILAGPGGSVRFPVPWARSEEISFLASPDELRDLLRTSGFKVLNWTDTTSLAREWFINLTDKVRQEGLPKLGFHLLMGKDDFPIMARNQLRNLEEERIVLAQVIAQKQETSVK